MTAFNCKCANLPPYVVSREQAKMWDISDVPGPERRYHERDFLRQCNANAAHEAGHVVAGALVGKRAHYAQIGQYPHVMPGTAARPSIAASLVPLLGGPIAECYALRSIPSPTRKVMFDHISAARAGHTARCDNCKIAYIVLIIAGDENDDAIADRWLEHWRRVVDAFDHLGVRCQTRMLAKALQERVHITGAEIERVIDYRYLATLRHLVDPEVERNDLPVIISNQGVLQ